MTTALEILFSMKQNYEICDFGLRNIYPEYLPEIGGDVDFSWDWDHENDMSSDEKLCGASCIEIEKSWLIEMDDMDDEEEGELIESIERALKMVKIYGGVTILVGGERKGYGEDKGEVLIDGKRCL